jgi:hypothetical protein
MSKLQCFEVSHIFGESYATESFICDHVVHLLDAVVKVETLQTLAVLAFAEFIHSNISDLTILQT